MSDAGDGEEGFDGVGHGRAGFDEGLDVGLEGLDLVIERGQERLEARPNGLIAGRGAAIG